MILTKLFNIISKETLVPNFARVTHLLTNVDFYVVWAPIVRPGIQGFLPLFLQSTETRNLQWL